jgi:hypothetical protein
MVHIDAATLRRHPIIGVLLGGATAIVIGSLLASGWGEVRDLLAQKEPRSVSVHEAVTGRGTRWVTLSEGRWHCEQAVTTERSSIVERWVRGPIETTEVPVTGPVAGEWLVATFDGPVDCARRAGSPLSGVMGSTQIFTSRATQRRWNRSGDRVAVLNVGASPRSALIMLVGLAGVALLGIGFAGHYLMAMLRSRERHAAPHSMAPIQPS